MADEKILKLALSISFSLSFIIVPMMILSCLCSQVEIFGNEVFLVIFVCSYDDFVLLV